MDHSASLIDSRTVSMEKVSPWQILLSMTQYTNPDSPSVSLRPDHPTPIPFNAHFPISQ